MLVVLFISAGQIDSLVLEVKYQEITSICAYFIAAACPRGSLSVTLSIAQIVQKVLSYPLI